MATSARNWKKPDDQEITLPSGNVCLVRKPGMDKLLSAGILPDSLTPLALEAVSAAQNKPQDHKKKGGEDDQLDPEIMKKFLEKEGALEDIFRSFDRVTAMCVVQPKVLLHYVQVMDSSGHPAKDVNNRPVWRDIPFDERVSSEVPETLEDGSPNPMYSASPPLYTDEVDGDDKEFIFNFASGAGQSESIATFPDERNDVATVQPGEDVPLPGQ